MIVSGGATAAAEPEEAVAAGDGLAVEVAGGAMASGAGACGAAHAAEDDADGAA
jgi:hypothetical protein